MKGIVRKYTSADYEMVSGWWKTGLDKETIKDLYPEESSYIFEFEGKPLLGASLYMMNSPIACMLENVISNPEYKVENRKELVNEFIEFLLNEAKAKGYKNIILLAYEDKLKDRWLDLGFKCVTNNISAFSKSL
jgi:hypothetical protein